MSFVVYNKIDEGNFGQIYLIRKNGGRDDQKTYAMKTIKKDTDNSVAQQRRICCNELDMFKLVHRIPFFIQLKYAFKTEQNHHFVMDFMSAGNLFDFLNGNRLPLQQAKICGASIVCALSYLHQHHVVYRDLKLENILIANDGHLLLTDFGLAREIQNNKQLNDEAGTFTYFAPEMISGTKHHGWEVDWWALGVTLCELLIGHAPFSRSADENPKETVVRKRILTEEPNLLGLRAINGTNDSSTERFIRALLIKDPTQRLGTGQNGYEAVKSHEYFRSINWTAVKLKKYKCLDLDVAMQTIPIDFSDQCTLILHEKRDFYYMAPELQPNYDDNGNSNDSDGGEIEGSAIIDSRVLSTRIESPESFASLDFVLANDLFIQTRSIDRAIKTLKQLFHPRKSVRFAPHTLNSSSDSSSSLSSLPKTKSQRQKNQYEPYTGSTRRSNRIAGRRTTLFT